MKFSLSSRSLGGMVMASAIALTASICIFFWSESTFIQANRDWTEAMMTAVKRGATHRVITAVPREERAGLVAEIGEGTVSDLTMGVLDSVQTLELASRELHKAALFRKVAFSVWGCLFCLSMPIWVFACAALRKSRYPAGAISPA